MHDLTGEHCTWWAAGFGVELRSCTTQWVWVQEKQSGEQYDLLILVEELFISPKPYELEVHLHVKHTLVRLPR